VNPGADATKASTPKVRKASQAARRAARLATLDGRVVGATSIWLTGSDEPMPPKRTYVTLGLERGGTSAIAGIQRALGLYLGDIEKGNNEDPAFVGYRLARIRKAIKRRNSEHDVWGFKYPKAVMYMPQIVEDLRNPHFIVVYRDAVATAVSHLGWTGRKNRKPAHLAVHEASSFTNTNTSFAFGSGYPTLVISHELAMAKPGDAIDEVARFLGEEPPADPLRQRIVDYLEPGSYKAFEEHFPEAAS
jgi:hypothetical protein